MKYGFEKEYFVTQNKEFVLVPHSLPCDECGYLAEARGPEDSNPVMAAYKLLAVEHELHVQAKKLGLTLLDYPWSKLPAEFLRNAQRQYGKNPYPTVRGNLYGKDFSTHDRIQRAGLHVHFSDLQTMTH